LRFLRRELARDLGLLGGGLARDVGFAFALHARALVLDGLLLRRDRGYALGATRLQVSTKVVVPAAISGIIASFVLAISRAVGETMIVLIAAGGLAQISLDPRDQVQTMTAFIGSTGIGDVPTGSIEYKTIFAVGLTLFVITLFMNVLSIRLVRRYREIYE
jgi:phosphate transport system permease protein